jgi:uncharacterized peroxidase-related enzyme
MTATAERDSGSQAGGSRTGERISRLRIPDETELSDKHRRQLDGLRNQLGYLPNWAKATALGAEHAVRFNDYLMPFLDPASGRLPHVERELISTVVSAENGCSYCRFNHAQSLGEAIGDRTRGLRIAVSYHEVEQLTDRQRRIADFAAKITNTPREVGYADFDSLRAVDLDDDDIFEVIQLAALFSAANRLTIALNVLPDPEFFD